MPMRMVIHTASGEFQGGGFFEPTPPQTGTDGQGHPIYDPAYSVVTVPGDRVPDSRLERYDASAPTKRRPATPAELAGGQAAAQDVEVPRQGEAPPAARPLDLPAGPPVDRPRTPF